jgi:hypothetical protein
MAILPRYSSPGCGTDMGKEQVRVQVPAKVAEIFIRPGRARFPVETWFRMTRIPSQPETVAVRPCRCLQGPNTLGYERMIGFRNVVLKGRGFPAIGYPTAHCAVSAKRLRSGENGEIGRSRRDKRPRQVTRDSTLRVTPRLACPLRSRSLLRLRSAF